MMRNLVPGFGYQTALIFGGCLQVAAKVSSPGIGRVLLCTSMGWIAFENVETRVSFGWKKRSDCLG